MVEAEAVLKRSRNLHGGRQDDDAWRLRRRGRALERIRIRWVVDDVAHESAGQRMQQVGNGDSAAAIVEDARASPDDIGLLITERVSERRAWREVVRVVKVVLPVITQPQRHRKTRPRLPVVLDVGANLFLQKRQVPVPLLLNKDIRSPELIRREAAEREGPTEIRMVVEASATPIGQLKPRLNQVASFGPGQALDELHVGLSTQEITLRPTARERARHDDAAIRRDADGWLPLVADEQLELKQQRWTKNRLLRVGHLLLVVREVGARRWERRAANAAVLVALILPVRPDGYRGLVGDLMADAGGYERLAVGLRDVSLNRPFGAGCINDGLLIVDRIVPGHQERSLAAMSQGATDDALDDVLLLRGLFDGKCVTRIEAGVAEDGVAFTVVFLAAWLRDDLDPPPAGASVLGGVWILVDLDLLHGGGAHSQRADFHAVDDDGNAGVAQGPGVEETRERRDVVLIEDGQAFEHVLIDGNGIEIAGGRRFDVRCAADGDLMRHIRDAQDEALRARGSGANAETGRRWFEPLVGGAYLVWPRRDSFEAKRSGTVGGG